MSDAVEAAGGSGGADRPSKKQKRDETEAAMLMARLGGPMEDEATARKRLQDAGFDPESPRFLQTTTLVQMDGIDIYETHIPMTYFCRVGVLKMCRYLLFKGALTTQTWNDEEDDDEINSMYSPMASAAIGGHVHICKWLCEHGGRGDIRRENIVWYSPLHYAVKYASTELADPPRIQRQRKTYRWLILNEALCPNDDGVVEMSLVREAFMREGRAEGPRVLEWAEGAVRTYDGFMTFLRGTRRREVPPFSRDGLAAMLNTKFRSIDSVNLILENLTQDQQLLLWNKELKRDDNGCILQSLSGHPGIRLNIADILGVVRGRELRIKRQLGPKLRSYLENESNRS